MRCLLYDIKKEGKVAIQTVIAQYGFAQDFSDIRNQVVALITSVNTIRQSHPIVNELYEKKSKGRVLSFFNYTFYFDTYCVNMLKV